MNTAKALAGQVSLIVAVVAIGIGSDAQTMQTGTGGATVTVLHNFNGADGSTPWGLVQGTDGNFYGATLYGGGSNSCPSLGCGTIFKITPSGTLTTLYNFCNQINCADGATPFGGLIQAYNGDFYGTTFAGSAYGTAFKITPGGALTTLHMFCTVNYSGICPDGEGPTVGLTQAASGILFGTTKFGGENSFGTIFKMTPTGTLTTLSSFTGINGGNPSGLFQAANGYLYGTTLGGAHFQGMIFKFAPNGALSTLYNFCTEANCADGSQPNNGLVQAANGDLYGTTVWGGASNNCLNGCGTIFKLTPGGTFTTIYSFCTQSGCPDGLWPTSGLVLASRGNLYGSAQGGASGGGTVFKITPSGAFTTIYSGCSQPGCSEGPAPGNLIQGTDGAFYGIGPGTQGLGSVVSLSVGEPPFVMTRPTIGVVGETVTILGYGLKGATSVTFNGTPATILYDAPTVIYAKVPAGATTGKVQVVTPSGTLTSNVAFEVAP